MFHVPLKWKVARFVLHFISVSLAVALVLISTDSLMKSVESSAAIAMTVPFLVIASVVFASCMIYASEYSLNSAAYWSYLKEYKANVKNMSRLTNLKWRRSCAYVSGFREPVYGGYLLTDVRGKGMYVHGDNDTILMVESYDDGLLFFADKRWFHDSVPKSVAEFLHRDFKEKFNNIKKLNDDLERI